MLLILNRTPLHYAAEWRGKDTVTMMSILIENFKGSRGGCQRQRSYNTITSWL